MISIPIQCHRGHFDKHNHRHREIVKVTILSVLIKMYTKLTYKQARETASGSESIKCIITTDTNLNIHNTKRHRLLVKFYIVNKFISR